MGIGAAALANLGAKLENFGQEMLGANGDVDYDLGDMFVVEIEGRVYTVSIREQFARLVGGSNGKSS